MAIFHPMAFTVEVTLKAERLGQQRRNVIHYTYAGVRPGVAELQNLLAGVENTVIDRYEDFVCTGTRWYELVAQDMHDQTGFQVARSINRLSTGGTQVAPGNVTLCLSKRTALPGQSNRGRFYIIDCQEDMFNGDDLNPFYNGTIAVLAAQLQAPQVSGRFLPSVGSRRQQGSTVITAITWDQVADSQRRRLKGRGI